MSSRERGHFFMAYIRGEAREQTTMFPATLDEGCKRRWRNCRTIRSRKHGLCAWAVDMLPPTTCKRRWMPEHALIVAHKITDTAGDNSLLLPMAEAAKQAVGAPALLNVVADAGYSNGEQAERREGQGIVPHVPANRAVNNKGDGTLLDRSEFHYEENTDTFRCPAGQRLVRKQLARKDRAVIYVGRAEVCGRCPLKTRCTTSAQRFLTRHLHDDALQRMQQRTTPQIMRLRRSTVEHPFATLKYRIFGHPRFLLRGKDGAQTEISLATIAYNLKRMMNVLGGRKFAAALCF